jgi:general secretion pathway protein G
VFHRGFECYRLLTTTISYVAERLHVAILSAFLPVQMNLKSIKWGLVIPCGWFVILVSAAIFLPSPEAMRLAPQILVLLIVWLLLTAVAIGFYFYRAWKRFPLVPNKGVYGAWLGFQTACVIAAVCLLIWLFLPNYITNPKQARERALRQDLRVMNALISQYTLDKDTPPQSLDDLVRAGYLKELPIDPKTGRKDTWVVRCSGNLSRKGIVGIESGGENGARTWNPRCD